MWIDLGFLRLELIVHKNNLEKYLNFVEFIDFRNWYH